MTKEEFQEGIYSSLIQKGYKAVQKTNGEAYNAKDIYFCPQAPTLYLLYITPGGTRVQKMGKKGFTADLSIKVNGPEDIDELHNELNNIILNQDESSLKSKSSGCLGVLILLFILTTTIFLTI